jgi:HlyD family secretion protein
MRTFLSLVIVVVLAGVFGVYYWHGGPEPLKFRTLPVDRGDLLIGSTATGTVEAVEFIDVGAQIVGLVTAFGPDRDRPGKTVDYNSRVKKGDVLAQLDDQPYLAARDNARATLRLQEADLLQARAREKQARNEFERAEKLKDTNSRADYENAESQYAIAQANRAMSEARLEQAKIALRQSEINLSYTTIVSPIDGVVIARRVNVGQTVVAGMNAPSLFLLARDLSHLVVWSAVDQADIGDIKLGQKVTFKVDACHDRIFIGKVAQIRLNAGLQAGVVTYGVIIEVDNADGALKPYMIANLRFEVARRTNVVLVPSQALRWRPTWEQISLLARAGLKCPTAKIAGADEKKTDTEEDNEPKVEVSSPTVWLLADDGLVRPVAVKTGLTDGLATELMGNEVPPGSAVVVNALRPPKPDFVSGFVAKVLKK